MFRNKIKYWAEIKGRRLKHLAKECDVSPQTFSKWVKNETQPNLEQAFIIARELQLTVDQLGEFIEQSENNSRNDI